MTEFDISMQFWTHCPECLIPLDGDHSHLKGCPYRESLAEAMQKVTMPDMALCSAQKLERQTIYFESPRPGLWGRILRLFGAEAGWVTTYWPERKES